MDKQFIGHFDTSMVQDLGEFSKRYLSSWIYEEATKTPYYITKILQDNIFLETSNKSSIKVPSITERKFSVKQPNLGFFNAETTFLYGIKVPDRQYKRGICSQNYNAINSIRTLLNKTITLRDISYAIEYMFTKPDCLLMPAIEQLKNTDKVGIALNTNFAVSLNTYSPEDIYLLWYKNKPVAEVYTNSKTIKVKYKHVKQEIQDYNKYIESREWKIL